jgi:hypothetical protein
VKLIIGNYTDGSRLSTENHEKHRFDCEPCIRRHYKNVYRVQTGHMGDTLYRLHG